MKGHLDLAVKTYEQGKMSKHIGEMKVGDTLDFKGPILKIAYKKNEFSEIGMVAGGTGIRRCSRWSTRSSTTRTTRRRCR